MTKQHTFEIGPFVGKHRTKTGARDAAIAEADRQLRGSHEPCLIQHAGWIGLAWWDELGWRAKVFESHAGSCSQGYIFGGTHHGYVKRDDVVSALRTHLAQCTWDGESQRVPFFLVTPVEVNEYLSWVEWQLRYKAAKETPGVTDQDAYQIASQSSSVAHARELGKRNDSFHETERRLSQSPETAGEQR